MADQISPPPDFDFVRVAINDVIERMEAKKTALPDSDKRRRVDEAITRLKACRNGLETDVFIFPLWFMIFLEQKEKI